MDRLEELTILVAIVDHGSLTAAARRLRRSPPAVTRALAALEQRVGVRLVDRTTRRLAPTEAGRALADRGRAILDDYDAAIREPSGGPIRGRLRVTAPVQFGRRHVAPLVTSFLDAFPQVQVELVLNDRNLDLIEEGLDAAVRIGPLSDSALLVRRVGEVAECSWRAPTISPAEAFRNGRPILSGTTRFLEPRGRGQSSGGSGRQSGPPSSGFRRVCSSTRWKPSSWPREPVVESRACSPTRLRTIFRPDHSSGCCARSSRLRCRCSSSQQAAATCRARSGHFLTTPRLSCANCR
jgi:hypothetical protein